MGRAATMAAAAACLSLGVGDLALLNGVLVPPLLGGQAPPAAEVAVAAPVVVTALVEPAPPMPAAPPPAPPPLPAPAPKVEEEPGPVLEAVPDRVVIYFEPTSARTDPGGLEIAVALAARASCRLAIEGHTDPRGGRRYNLRLSERRAAFVAAELARRGVPRTRMIVAGYGAKRPAARGPDEADLARNRRVEIHCQGG